MRLPFLCLLLITMCCAQVSGQSDYTLRQLDNRNGLSNSCINNMYQDADHLLWLGTWDGLNVFDGTTFHFFNFIRGDSSHGLLNNVVFQILEDRKQNIWFTTLEGISRYDKKSGLFQHYFYGANRVKNSMLTELLLAVDTAGTVFATSSGRSLYRFNARKNLFEPYPILLDEGHIIKMLFDADNRLYILNDRGTADVYEQIKSDYRYASTLSRPWRITNLYLFNGEILLTTDKRKLVRIDHFANQAKEITVPHEIRNIGAWNGRYLISWSTKGMAVYDHDLKPEKELDSLSPQLKQVRISSFLADGRQMLWVGTEGNGIMNINGRQHRFHLVQQLSNGNSFNIPVRAFCAVDSDIWVGTKGNGIAAIRNLGETNESSFMMQSFHAVLDIFENCVYAIQKGKDNNVYIGSDAPGISIFDKKSRKLIFWNQVINSSKFPYFNSVHCIMNDDDGSLWLGLESGGLMHLSLSYRNSRFTIEHLEQFMATGADTGPVNNVIYSLAKGSGNSIWIGCRYGGLMVFDKTTKRFRPFHANGHDGSLSNNDVLSVFVDSKKRVWAGTSFGLNWLSEAQATQATPLFHTFNTSNGLPNNTIHGITEDNKGFIWISTNNGIARIDPDVGTVVQFKTSDGLQSNEFSDNAVFKDERGRIFFGGIYGFNYFRPEEIPPIASQSNLLITDLRMADTKDREQSLTVLHPTDLGPQAIYEAPAEKNYFELTVKPIDYNNPEKCQYRYKLEGFDRAWHQLEGSGKLFYGQLPPGHYRLYMQWSNGEGAWTKEIPLLALTIKPFFWVSPAAIVIYVMLAAGMLFLYLQYRRNKLALKHRLELEHRLREKDEAIHQEQLDFFTNIAHELKTPLTIVLGSLERYLGDDRSNVRKELFLANATQEANRLQYLVSQLLEFRKAEAGKLTEHASPVNLSELLSHLSQLFEPLNEGKNLSFNSHIEPALLLWVDKDKLEKIVFNLLSNAVKHTGSGQHVMFTAQSSADKHWIEIIVANSGCTLSATELSQLFERFFSASGSGYPSISTGIGLAFTAELVRVLGGSIDLYAKNDWIYFTVRLPLRPVHVGTGFEPQSDTQPSALIKSLAQQFTAAKEGGAEQDNKSALIEGVQNPAKRKILVVEDEPAIRALLKEILEPVYTIFQAVDGRQALALMSQSKPDLVISDIMMPEMDGLELCRTIKQTPATCYIPVLLLTARGTEEQKIEGYETGADAYLAKPFRTPHLLLRVQRLFDYRDRLRAVFTHSNYGEALEDAELEAADNGFLKALVRVVEDHLDDEKLDIALLEKKLAISRRDLYRKIKAATSMTPVEFIKNLRMQKAAWYLQHSQLNITEIFYKTGFTNQSHFFREFKKRFGVSPGDYRQRAQLSIE